MSTPGARLGDALGGAVFPLDAAAWPEIREGLSRLTGPLLPYGYYRFISKEGSLAVVEKSFRESLAGGRGLALGWRDSNGRLLGWINSFFLGWDTDFFDIAMARIEHLYAFGLPPRLEYEVKRALVQRACGLHKADGVRYLYMRIDTNDLRGVHALGDCGFQWMETLVWHSLSATEASFDEIKRLYPVRDARQEDVEPAARIAESVFRGHDRFHNEETIPLEKSDELMRRWVENSYRGGFNDFLLVAEREGRAAGFMTGKKYDWDLLGYPLSAITLGAADPQARGAFVSLAVAGLERLFEMGSRHVELSVPIEHHAPARVWSYLGLKPGHSRHTFRAWL